MGKLFKASSYSDLDLTMPSIALVEVVNKLQHCLNSMLDQSCFEQKPIHTHSNEYSIVVYCKHNYKIDIYQQVISIMFI